MNCTCKDWSNVIKDHNNLFQEHPKYGAILTWLEVTKESSYHKLHSYAIQINFCPFCGKKLY